MDKIKATTILCVKKDNKVAIGGDGQVSLGDSILKRTAKKVRKIHNNEILIGFAGATADAITLFDKFEAKLDEFKGNLKRAAVELAKDWRTDKYLRRLEAMMAVADKKVSLIISGTGDVVEPDDNIIGIGSGGAYALAAARSLIDQEKLSAEDIAKKAMIIAAEICIYTNTKITIEKL